MKYKMILAFPIYALLSGCVGSYDIKKSKTPPQETASVSLIGIKKLNHIRICSENLAGDSYQLTDIPANEAVHLTLTKKIGYRSNLICRFSISAKFSKDTKYLFNIKENTGEKSIFDKIFLKKNVKSCSLLVMYYKNGEPYYSHLKSTPSLNSCDDIYSGKLKAPVKSIDDLAKHPISSDFYHKP